VLEGRSDLAIAAFPVPTGGGFGLVKRAARSWIRGLTGFDAEQPLSGQRAITASCLGTCRPIARGFGVEVAMTVDALRGGLRVREIEVPGLSHRPTGRGPRGFLHRGRQGVDIAAALANRTLGRR
jgi:glucosyl-3-phosphoglycerate synthase